MKNYIKYIFCAKKRCYALFVNNNILKQFFTNMNIRTLKNIEIKGKKILLRSELNVPLKNGKIIDDTRIKKALPTIQYLQQQGAKIIICAHLGRPKGQFIESLSLSPIAKRLKELLQTPIQITKNIIGPEVNTAIQKLQNGEILLLENIRFMPEEMTNDTHFAKELSKLADIYVSDAFGAIHRSHASTEGVGHFLPSYAGLLVEKEIQALESLFIQPHKPIVIIVSGAKMETKIKVIEKFLNIADNIIIGGGIANTFLAAQGYNIGTSLIEKTEIETALNILKQDTENKIFLAHDAIVSNEISEEAQTKNIPIDTISDTEKILDMGQSSLIQIQQIIQNAKTIVWNGPLGIYELTPFSFGTKKLIQYITESKAHTIVGGGDSIDAIHKFGFSETQFTHLSTGGGASLSFLEGKKLPGIEILKK
jgi:phosphoglycerate kinase